MFGDLKYHYRVQVKYARKPRRYGQILKAIAARRPRTIVEVGVHTAARAKEMIETAARWHPASEITYFGFDLFDLMTGELLEQELSKKPLTEAQVRDILAPTGARIELFRGFSQETLPLLVEKRRREPVDFIFIDGGHAIATIQSDWDNLAAVTGPETLVLFDDYYVDCPHLTDRFGCNRVLDGLDPAVFSSRVLPLVDSFGKDESRLAVALAEVARKSG